MLDLAVGIEELDARDAARGRVRLATIGDSIALFRFSVSAGVKVMLADIEKAALDKAVEELKRANAAVDGVVVDVSLRSAIEEGAAKTVERFGKVHILVNNAGVGGEGPMSQWTNAGWEWTIGVNLMSVIYGFQTFVPLIARHGEGGHIVSTASTAGMITSGLAQYQVTKHGVVALSEATRAELAQRNIGVSVLCPGFVRTNILDYARNIPERFAGTSALPLSTLRPPDEASARLVEFMKKRVNEGIDPLYVGELVREAIEEDALYVFTDTEFEPLFDQRVAEIKKGLDRIRGRVPRH